MATLLPSASTLLPKSIYAVNDERPVRMGI